MVNVLKRRDGFGNVKQAFQMMLVFKRFARAMPHNGWYKRKKKTGPDRNVCTKIDVHRLRDFEQLLPHSRS
jgi:hypothetical protein